MSPSASGTVDGLRILVVSIVYPPDVVSTAGIASGIAGGLADLGHDVSVLTSVPHFNPPDERLDRRFRLAAIDRSQPVGVTRCFAPRKTEGLLKRLVGIAILHLTMLLALIRWHRDRDAVIVISPPLTFAVLGATARLLSGAKLVYNAQELWPDVPRDLGVIKNRRLLALLGAFEQMIYRRFDATVAIGPGFARRIRERGGPRSRVEVIPNFVDTGWIRPTSRRNALSREFGLDEKKVLLYAGNIGLTQDIELLVAAAGRLAGDGVEVVVVGGGAGKRALQTLVTSRAPRNVRVLDYLPEERVSELYGAADVILVPLRAGHDKSTTPSKIFSAMAAERPILACASPDTDIASQIAEARAGVCVPPGDVDAFVAAARELLGRGCVEWNATTARAYAQRHSAAAVASAYDQLLRDLLRNS